MKLVSFDHRNRYTWGVLEGTSSVFDLGAVSPYPDLRASLAACNIEEFAAWRSAATCLNTGDVQLLPPIPQPGKILCVGLNYADHMAEMARPATSRPPIFTRFADTLIGDGEGILAPWCNATLDYEGELAVVIGTGGRHIAVEDALDHVLGYSVFNDASVRDYQRHSSQFTPGKNFPKTGAFGPHIITADEIGVRLENLAIRTRLNGAVVQQSTLGNMIFSVAEIISYCSEWTTLSPGDVIATGTPGGVGSAHQPPLWIHPGDVVQVEIESIGHLTNPVVEEPHPAADIKPPRPADSAEQPQQMKERRDL